ncbi:MAG TPA: hypothetical protein VGR37_22905, partial [Longimicrobiaceae bacterium]|nr:hypothetical protein [Longimicrobiaceae bacterium]
MTEPKLELHEETRAHVPGGAETLPVPLLFPDRTDGSWPGETWEDHEAFFRGLLGDVEEPTVPYGVAEVGEREIGEARLLAEERLAVRLWTRARSLGVSTSSLCHVAWALVLARATGRRDVVFGTVLAGSEGEGGEARPLADTLPARVHLGSLGVEATVRATHALLAELLRHRRAPLALAQRCSGVPAPTPLFTSLFSYRDGGSARPDDAAWTGPAGTSCPVTLSVDDGGEGLWLSARVAAPAGAMRVCRMMRTALERLVEALEVSPGRALGSIDVLPEEERRQVVEEWNATAAAYPRDAC